ncbi:acyl-CoA thioesterase [Lentisphaera profundi]|uniref:Acyl-CoA thioesterase n=1 Tax=Lentisphaera profundi TaxID=1658616 RepID=A0ABY7VUB0_9BACT|nr:acyl-CoA thioesterase [Lentisphaera profundi]WDE96805.1 acyl-CoA thioesterase [Lentisphaera profundi]
MLKKSQTEMSVLVTPEMANFNGNMHGGDLLKLLDRVAYTCATRYCGKYAVTLSVDQVTFKQSIKIGELLTFLASVNYTGRTSMEIGVKVIAEDLHQQSLRHTNTCYFTMVAVDKDSKSVVVPKFEPETPKEAERFQLAEQRRERRMLQNKVDAMIKSKDS